MADFGEANGVEKWLGSGVLGNKTLYRKQLGLGYVMEG